MNIPQPLHDMGIPERLEFGMYFVLGKYFANADLYIFEGG